MLKVINVVGARPNFMKVAPIVEAMKRREQQFTPLVVHTGQHYDAMMSDAFFRDLESAGTGCLSRSWFRLPRGANGRSDGAV